MQFNTSACWSSGTKREAQALFPKLKSAAELVREPEFCRLDCAQHAQLFELPDEIQTLLNRFPRAGEIKSVFWQDSAFIP